MAASQSSDTVLLEIPQGEFKALLFDCDGTIADSMPLHYVAWNRALGEHGAVFPEDTFYAWGGMPAAEIIAILGRQQGIVMPVEDVEHRKEALYYEMLHELRAVPEVLAEIDRNHALGAARLPMAVVSGSTRDSVTRSLIALGLLDRFETLVCAGDYARSKPDPEPFLTAAARLGVEPSSCLVFEDTEMGIQSATAAGMASVKILQPWERKK
ncbi:MAG TPA: HAD family phosphatase [Acidobacteriaceae bacterium]|nr:HAD family phosphatase [Acidobacteriaceae bacterium]